MWRKIADRKQDGHVRTFVGVRNLTMLQTAKLIRHALSDAGSVDAGECTNPSPCILLLFFSFCL